MLYICCIYIYTLYKILGHHKMIPMAYPNFLSIIYLPPLPLSFLLPSSVKSFCPEFFISSFIDLTLLVLSLEYLLPSPPTWSFFTFLVSVVTLGHILTSKHSELGTMHKREHVSICLSGSGLIYYDTFLSHHLPAKVVILDCFCSWIASHSVDVPHFHHKFNSHRTFRLFPLLSFYQ